MLVLSPASSSAMDGDGIHSKKAGSALWTTLQHFGKIRMTLRNTSLYLLLQEGQKMSRLSHSSSRCLGEQREAVKHGETKLLTKPTGQYLLSGQHYDFPSYRSVVHEVTQAFAAASREVLAVEAELAGPRAQPVLARHVRSLQELEQTRLATVALLQVMGTPGVSEQDPEKLHQLKIKVIKTMEAIGEVLQELRFDAESAE